MKQEGTAHSADAMSNIPGHDKDRRVVCNICGSDNVCLFVVESIRIDYAAVVEDGKVAPGEELTRNMPDSLVQEFQRWCEDCGDERDLVIKDTMARTIREAING